MDGFLSDYEKYVTSIEGKMICTFCKVPIKGKETRAALRYHFTGRSTKNTSVGCVSVPADLKESCEYFNKSIINLFDAPPEVVDIILGTEEASTEIIFDQHAESTGEPSLQVIMDRITEY